MLTRVIQVGVFYVDIVASHFLSNSLTDKFPALAFIYEGRALRNLHETTPPRASPYYGITMGVVACVLETKRQRLVVALHVLGGLAGEDAARLLDRAGADDDERDGGGDEDGREHEEDADRDAIDVGGEAEEGVGGLRGERDGERGGESGRERHLLRRHRHGGAHRARDGRGRREGGGRREERENEELHHFFLRRY